MYSSDLQRNYLCTMQHSLQTDMHIHLYITCLYIHIYDILTPHWNYMVILFREPWRCRCIYYKNLEKPFWAYKAKSHLFEMELWGKLYGKVNNCILASRGGKRKNTPCRKFRILKRSASWLSRKFSQVHDSLGEFSIPSRTGYHHSISVSFFIYIYI
jgi:hypothetical protein